MSMHDESRAYGLRRRSRCYSDDDTEEISRQSKDVGARPSYKMRRSRSFDDVEDDKSDSSGHSHSRSHRRPRSSVRLVEFKSCKASTMIQIAILLVIVYMIYDSNIEHSATLARFQTYRDDGLQDGLSRLEKRAAELQDQIERLKNHHMQSSVE